MTPEKLLENLYAIAYSLPEQERRFFCALEPAIDPHTHGEISAGHQLALLVRSIRTDMAQQYQREDKRRTSTAALRRLYRASVSKQGGIRSHFAGAFLDEQGRQCITDGFTLLAMGFTGKEALAWKMKYINAFNAMEQELRSQQQGLTEADFSALSYEARAIIKMELQQKQQAKQIAELTTRQQETRTMVNQTLSAIARPSTSDAEEWKEDINHTIRQMCEEYGLNYHTTIGDMYAELEKLGGVNLVLKQQFVGKGGAA